MSYENESLGVAPVAGLEVGATGTIRVVLDETGIFSTLVDWDEIKRSEWHHSGELENIKEGKE